MWTQVQGGEAGGDGAGALTPATKQKGSICEVCCSVTKSRPVLCDPLNCSTLGSPVLHHLPEFA